MTHASLKLIVDNPFQPRTTDDAEHVEKLARSIAADGILQLPTARRVNGHFELAFGHSRRKAFEWLMANWKKLELPERYEGYTVMPLEEQVLTDEQMYRYAVTENVQRKDLSPTELARSLKQYMEQFGATSKQAGELFGMNEATVRGMVRLLDLPQAAQEALDAGKITQNTARTLLSMQKVAPPEKVIETVVKIVKKENKALPDEVIEETISHMNDVMEMWDEGNRDGKPLGGRGGWPLEMKRFPNHLLPRMTEETVGKYEKHLEHLTNPPACTACPFYTKVRGSHYCGLKVCFEMKRIAWERHIIEQASKRLSIPIYDAEDGGYVLLMGYENSHKKVFTSRHAGLRLLPKSAVKGYASQWGFDGVDDEHVFVVATGTAMDKLDNTGRNRSKGGKKSEKEKAEMRMMRVYRMRRKELMWEFTATAKRIFDGVPVEALRKINRWKFIGIDDRIVDEWLKGRKATAETDADMERRELIWRMLDGTCSHYTRSSMATILEELQEHADEWGVKIPKTLVALAEQFDAEIDAAGKSVSAATVKAKGGKK